MSEFRWSESEEPGVTRNAQGEVTDYGCGDDHDVERRVRVRMAEAENAARVAREALRVALDQGDDLVDSASLERMAHTARLHEMLASALADVLDGGF